MKAKEFAHRFAVELKALIQHNPDFSDFFIDGLVYRRRDWVENRVEDLITGRAKKWESSVLRTQFCAGPWKEPPEGGGE